MPRKMLIAYASRTGTKRNLKELRKYHWRLLVSATGVQRTEGFRYAIDNGAWTAYQQGKGIDLSLFEKVCINLGQRADWVAVPDIVNGGFDSLILSLQWLPYVLNSTKLALLPMQPGIPPELVTPYLGSRVGLFIGGDTKWKIESLPMWGQLAKKTGCVLHVGRVNSKKRILHCYACGAHSFDGTSASRFAVTVQPLDRARRECCGFRSL